MIDIDYATINVTDYDPPSVYQVRQILLLCKKLAVPPPTKTYIIHNLSASEAASFIRALSWRKQKKAVDTLWKNINAKKARAGTVVVAVSAQVSLRNTP